jgi:hypothetical protein
MKLHKTIPLLMTLTIFGAGGCAGVGAMWFKAFGPPDVQAKYTPPNESTVVLVENYRNPVMTEFDADRIAREVGEDLTTHKVVVVVDQDKVRDLRDSDPEKFRDMTIPSIGKALGAKQVIYVDLLASDVSGDATHNLVGGQADARVRVVEVESGHTIWPSDSQGGYPVGAKVPYADASPTAAKEVHNALLASLSEQIGRLFHKWKPETQGEGDAANAG